MKNYHFIYKTTHNNGYYYIGRHSTKNLKDGYLGSGKWIKSIKNKSELITEIIEYSDNPENLRKIEQKYIDEHFGKPGCMNFLKSSLGFNQGYKPTDEAKKKMSISQTGKKRTPEHIKNLALSNTGKKRSEQAINNMCKAQKIAQNREEVRLKISFAQKGKKRKPLDELHRKNIGKSLLGKKQKIEKCNYCQKEGGLNMMKRYHFDNCKYKYSINEKG
jgi:hypothetical protein